MITAVPTPDAHTPRDSRAAETLLLAGAGLLGLVVCGGAGWIAGGADTAWAAGLGMAVAAVGGGIGWFAVTLLNRGGAPITAAPMLGMAVRLLVTAAGVGFLVLGAEMPRKPVLFAALFGYLLMMAAETVLLYRFASRNPAVSAETAVIPEVSGPSRENPDR